MLLTIIKALRFLKLMKYDISIEGLLRFLSVEKWDVIFYNTVEGDCVVRELGLKAKADTEQAFLHYKKGLRLVFIDDSVTYDGKQALLLHEIGHIIYGHTKGYNDPDSTQCQMEANNFVGAVLQLHKNRRLYMRCVICAAITLVVLTVTISSVAAYNACRTVYVTPSGSKYHTDDCSAVDYNTAYDVPIYKAKRHYGPCKLCNP